MEIAQLEELCRFFHDKTGLYPQETRLAYIPRENWPKKCQKWGFDPAKTRGIYVWNENIAYVDLGGDFPDLTTVHEFIGHGTFREHHPEGKRLAELPFEEARQEAERQSPLIEGFAIWTEHYLAREKNLEGFARKYGSETHDIIKSFVQTEQAIGAFGLCCALGFPKYYDQEMVYDMIGTAFGQEKRDSARLGILYGTQEPEEPIELFTVSDIGNRLTGWMTLFSYAESRFEEKLRLFSAPLREPLLTGELIFGDEDYFKMARRQWELQPITPEAIEHNQGKCLELQELLSEGGLTDTQIRIYSKYAQLYQENAQNLARGIRD
jgi:hypothetical protein